MKVLQRQSFDPFGQRRNPTDWKVLLDSQLTRFDSKLTTRGFTGHEQLDEVGLIHMNGRIYDAKLGRFLQADPFVQAAGNTQSFNRYSYVLNNPLNAVDPSGYFLGGLFKGINKLLGKFAPIVAIAAAIFIPGAQFMIAALGKFGAAVAAGFISGGIATGSLKGAFAGAFSAAVFYGVGSAFKDVAGADKFGTLAHAGKTVAHGFTGGVMSVLNGGKFGNGFMSAGLTQLAAPAINGIDEGARFSAGRVFSAAVVGGTASAMTGGKFANGAVTGAFSRAFNDESHWQRAKVEAQRLAEKTTQWVKNNFRNILTVAGGTGQVVGGAAMCTTGAGCIAGSVIMAHGANNIYEGVTSEDGLLRRGYQKLGEFVAGDSKTGDFAYGALDIGMSIHGATKLVLKPDSWRLFRNIPSDYTRAYRTMGARSLMLETSVDGVTAEDTYKRVTGK